MPRSRPESGERDARIGPTTTCRTSCRLVQRPRPVLQIEDQENPAHDRSAPAPVCRSRPRRPRPGRRSISARRARAAGRERSSAANPAALLDILRTEMDRNVAVLRKEPVPPYFMAYTVSEVRSTELAASFGAMVVDNDSHLRTLGVDIRTGDYALDNTHEIRGEPAPPTGLWPFRDSPRRLGARHRRGRRGWPPTAPTGSRSNAWRASRRTWRPW
ncbi:MAG: hypothetical protein MZV70_19575 [Desulfobacterales bacterium]|nr:hypothetical protein [Desulfobacterales bacterium]